MATNSFRSAQRNATTAVKNLVKTDDATVRWLTAMDEQGELDESWQQSLLGRVERDYDV